MTNRTINVNGQRNATVQVDGDGNWVKISYNDVDLHLHAASSPARR